MNKKILFAMSLIAMVALATSVHALSFGTSIKDSEITLARGGTGTFRILFFTRDSDTVRFSLLLEEPPEVFIIDYPETIELNSGSGNDYILIDNEYVSTKTLEIRVSVPVDADPGEHTVLLKASSSQEGQSPIGVNTEKTFLLKVNVLEGPSKSAVPETSENNTEDGIIENALTENKEVESMGESNEVSSPASGMVLTDNSYFWAILVFLIVLAAYLVYRKI
jgi:hypothetical protein